MTRLPKSVRASAGVLCALVLWVTPASAEWFGDLWVGLSRTKSADLKVRILDVEVESEVDYTDTMSGGFRVGYWFESARWLGLAVDASYFTPDSDVSVVPVSALLMLRLPLFRSTAFPSGRLQPYIAGGPGLFVSTFSGDLGEDLGGQASDTSIDLGLDARAGLTFLFTKQFGIFFEGRMTRVSPEWSFQVLGHDTTVKTDLTTYHLIGGLTFRFQF
jgi:hypothetical protein